MSLSSPVSTPLIIFGVFIVCITLCSMSHPPPVLHVSQDFQCFLKLRMTINKGLIFFFFCSTSNPEFCIWTYNLLATQQTSSWRSSFHASRVRWLSVSGLASGTRPSAVTEVLSRTAAPPLSSPMPSPRTISLYWTLVVPVFVQYFTNEILFTETNV